MTEQDIQLMGLTKQRRAVLEVIRSADAHLTANEVFLNARIGLPGISFATVYNSLRFLKEAGQIAEIQFGSGASRFDRITSRHDHAICTVCDALVDIEMDHPPDLVNMAARISNFKPDSLEFTLRGLCPACVNNDAETTGISA